MTLAYIVLSLTGLLAALFMKSKWLGTKVWVFICSVLILATVFYMILEGLILPGFDMIPKGHSYQVPWLEITLYFTMILGMAGKYFFDAIGDKNSVCIQKWQMIKPLFVSPMVFGTVYAGIQEQTSVVLLLIFSFQNGFFWQSVLYKKTTENQPR